MSLVAPLTCRQVGSLHGCSNAVNTTGTIGVPTTAGELRLVQPSRAWELCILGWSQLFFSLVLLGGSSIFCMADSQASGSDWLVICVWGWVLLFDICSVALRVVYHEDVPPPKKDS